MSWYKYSKDFSDRNVINGKIAYLKEVKDVLEVISKLIFQSATLAKQNNVDIISSKKISSYPILYDILIEADTIALDSPWKFAALCEEAIGNINVQVSELIAERKKINKIEKGIDIEKGWV